MCDEIKLIRQKLEEKRIAKDQRKIKNLKKPSRNFKIITVSIVAFIFAIGVGVICC